MIYILLGLVVLLGVVGFFYFGYSDYEYIGTEGEKPQKVVGIAFIPLILLTLISVDILWPNQNYLQLASVLFLFSGNSLFNSYSAKKYLNDVKRSWFHFLMGVLFILVGVLSLGIK